MKPIEYYDLRLNDKIFVHDSFFTIERINDANLVNRDLTKISLIKESSPYYKIEPPADQVTETMTAAVKKNVAAKKPAAPKKPRVKKQ